jgi:hypothetical protein
MLKDFLLASDAYTHHENNEGLLRVSSNFCMQEHTDPDFGRASLPELRPSAPNSRIRSPACKESLAPYKSGASSEHQQGQPSEFSSLINELAEKYGCGGQDNTAVEEDEAGSREERTFMTPQLRVSQEKFREALQLAIQVVNCRSQLLKQLHETQT